MATFSLVYLFEEIQRLKLEVYDADSVYNSNDASQLVLAKQDYQGMLQLAVDLSTVSIRLVWCGKEMDSAPLWS